MPRELTFRIKKSVFQVSAMKVDRKKLYGWTEIIALDEKGDECSLLTADESGRYIIPLTGTGFGVLDENGRWIGRDGLKTVDENGKPAKLVESSYKATVELSSKASLEEYLDHAITDIYFLGNASEEFAKIVGEEIYQFQYSYLDSYNPSPAFIISAGDGLFLMIGVKNKVEMLCFGDCDKLDDTDEEYADFDAGDGPDFSNLF